MPDTQISDEMVRVAAETMKQRRRDTIEGRAPHATYEELARAALEAALSGHVVVPREPTPAMLRAGHAGEYDSPVGRYSNIYRAMIQAAPPVPEMEG